MLPKYTFRILARDPNTNILDPLSVTQGFFSLGGKIVYNPNYSFSGFIPVSPFTSYQANGVGTNDIILYVDYYDADRRYLSSFNGLDTDSFTTPAQAAFAVVSFKSEADGQNPFLVSISPGFGSGFEAYYTTLEIFPLWDNLARTYEREEGQYYFREKLQGTLKVVNSEYSFLTLRAYDTRMILEIEEQNGKLSIFRGEFYKTDCFFDEDGRLAEINVQSLDRYTQLLAGIDRIYNIVEEGPEMEEITYARRPVLQVYIAGDNVLTQIIGNTFWEQKLISDPVVLTSELENTYKFALAETIRLVPASYAPLLSTNITGEYDDSRVNLNGLYRVTFDVALPLVRYKMERVSDSAVLYRTEWVPTFVADNISTIEFRGDLGDTGETGAFFFAEYRIFARYATDSQVYAGAENEKIPANDLIESNPVYRYAIPYSSLDFFAYEETQTRPGQFGRLPEGTPGAGEYYKKLEILPGFSYVNSTPISPSNWRALSVWLVHDLQVKNFEFLNRSETVLRDSYPLHSVVQALLLKISSQVTFSNEPEYSEFLYGVSNPFGPYTYIDFDSLTLEELSVNNLEYHITPKSNILAGSYSEPAKKADISLNYIFELLRSQFNLYWFIDSNGRLRIEHISWFQNGGTYDGLNPIIGADITYLQNPRNAKTWAFALNKYRYDKANMPERIEYQFMDKSSKAFEGFAIDMISGVAQKGNKWDYRAGAFTSDIDLMLIRPQDFSKDGFAILCTVPHEGVKKVPFVRLENQDVETEILQNGFISGLFLREKYSIFGLPSNQVQIGNKVLNLTDNINRNRTQSITFPLLNMFDPMQLIRTGLGVGEFKTVSVDLDKLMITAEVKHSNE